MKLHYFIKSKKGHILVIEENGIYDVPYINSDVNNKNKLIRFFNNKINEQTFNTHSFEFFDMENNVG